MNNKNYNHGSQFRIAPSRTFIEYFDEETKTWHRYNDQDMGYVIMLNEDSIISSEGLFIKDKECPLVWELIDHGDVFEEFESEEMWDWRKKMFEDLNDSLVSVAWTMEQIQSLPLFRMFNDALQRHDLPKFTFCLLAWLDFHAMEFHLDELIKKGAASCLHTGLKEDMTDEERLSASCELLGDIIALSKYINTPHFDMFSTDKYLAPLLADFPFLKDIRFSEYFKGSRGNIFSDCSRYDNLVDLFNSNKEVEFPNKSIRKALGTDGLIESGYNTELYMKSPVFVKEALYLPKLFKEREKQQKAWSLTCGNEAIDKLLEGAWKSHDIIMLIWWFCIASQIKSGKEHFDEADLLAGRNGDIHHMYMKLLEWDALEEEWFDPADMPFWRSRCIHELTFLAEDALSFFGAGNPFVSSSK